MLVAFEDDGIFSPGISGWATEVVMELEVERDRAENARQMGGSSRE